MNVKIKRVYEESKRTDGFRVLVDRLWPRGITKVDAKIDLWLKEVSPSTHLRKWFDHDPEKWDGFLLKYKAELLKTAAYKELRAIPGSHKTVTLLYSAKDTKHNNAAALLIFLDAGE